MTYQDPGQPNQGYYAPVQQTNTMAIVALISAFVFAPLAIIFGHIARGQIKRTGEGGNGLATAGLVLGYVFTLVWILIVGLVMLGVFVAVHDLPTVPTTVSPTSYSFPTPAP